MRDASTEYREREPVEPAPTSAMRVGVVAHYYPPHVGGLETVARRVAGELTSRGFRVEVLTSAVDAPPGVVSEDGVRVRRLRVVNLLERHGVPFPVFGPALLTRAWQLVRRCDVVQVHDMLYLSSWVVAALCRLTRTPYVVTQHVGLVDHPSRVVRLVQRLVWSGVGGLVLRGAACVLPISPLIARRVTERVGEARVEVLRNGVDAGLFRPPARGEREQVRGQLGLPRDEVLVLFVGRFVPKKGFDVVVAATGHGYHTVFVGGSRPAEVPASERQHFLGQLPAAEVARVYRACEVFVCASTGEGPMTPMEGMLSGCCVLLRDDPALRGLDLGDGVSYLDMTPASLAAELTRLSADPEAIRAGAERAVRAGAHIPTWDEHADSFAAVLRRISEPTG